MGGQDFVTHWLSACAWVEGSAGCAKLASDMPGYIGWVGMPPVCFLHIIRLCAPWRLRLPPHYSTPLSTSRTPPSPMSCVSLYFAVFLRPCLLFSTPTQAGLADPDIFFTDRPRESGLGQRNKEYISIWADDCAVLPAAQRQHQHSSSSSSMTPAGQGFSTPSRGAAGSAGAPAGGFAAVSPSGSFASLRQAAAAAAAGGGGISSSSSGGCGMRTPLQCYAEFMAAFRDEFAGQLGCLIEEVVVGSGPCGELRYPSYVEANGWRFPGVGEFQCYDR